MNKEEYKKEIVRMWDSLRVNDVGNKKCKGVICGECPLYDICESSTNAFEMIEIVEKWSKEHPQKNKISKLEYDILKSYIECEFSGRFWGIEPLMTLLEKGYFKGANEETDIEHYFNNCEVEDDNEKK